MPDRILIAEDNKNLCRILENALSEAGYEVVVALGGDAAVHEIKSHPFDLVISDMRMPGASGTVVFQEARAQEYQPDVILMTAFGDTREAVRLMRDGAADYILKDFDPEELVTRVGQVLERRRLKQESTVLKGRIETLKEQISLHQFDMIVGQSRAMQDALSLAERVARTDANVLLLGESGTGKEVFAQAIHAASKRSDAPFVPVNCGALPETLLESELFGHERGAFTGAIRTKPGRFEFAEGGTVFLDEIGEVPQSIQVKLLRVLQDRTYVRVGGEEMRRADVRVIAATNRNLEEMIHMGRFREDLYYRLNVFPIRLMPLRDRREDIPALVEFFLKQQERSLEEIAPDALEHLRAYEFPGNIRELQNLIERACILAGTGRIERVHFPIGKTRLTADPAELLSLGLSLDQIEKRLIKEALERAQGNKTKAASLLGISRRALYSRMESHGIPIGGAESEPAD
ncbi:MAG: sigma-54-dependent Fis family transcriptional regulator [Candidatus Eisenbacteria bacterium]|uniref:Sigma-54-dependent Fis family transcriptional regulator n=1 Tax=Eiseniibacteriota bacterium TaxID=2212470 RepID=A0A538TAL0_UNCEI|nr:MAG: sigma-54-dependent Fis family transcriptional regulator [Candidatus Eisenbacteria bacterium]